MGSVREADDSPGSSSTEGQKFSGQQEPLLNIVPVHGIWSVS